VNITEIDFSGQYAAIGITLTLPENFQDRSPGMLIYQVWVHLINVGVHVSKTYEVTEMKQLRISCFQFSHRNFSGFCGTI
jgi:hypothetical protein